MAFNERLKMLREERGLYQTDVARALNYGSTAISNYESGRNEPSISDLIKLARFFNVSLDYLMCASDDRTVFREKEKGNPDDMFLYNYKKLSNEGKKILRVFLDFCVERFPDERGCNNEK